MRDTIKKAAYWTTNKGGFFNTMGCLKSHRVSGVGDLNNDVGRNLFANLTSSQISLRESPAGICFALK
jgi:hypothetical protein